MAAQPSAVSADDPERSSATGLQPTPKKAHVTPLFISLHSLPVAARIKFKTQLLAYKTELPHPGLHSLPPATLGQ